MRERCGKTERHTPHWWDMLPEVQERDPRFWCDGKPPNPHLVED
jgi:hypothetical protein